jgi:transcriptional regulator with PAS, ATPase and Fis domain
MQSNHPIIQAYISTSEGFDEIFERLYDKNQYLELVFFKILKEYGKQFNQELLDSIDQAIINGHPDPNIFMLYITHCIDYFSKKHLEKAHSLCSIALSLDQEEIQPAVKALFTQYRGILCFNEGKIIECMNFLDKAIALIDKKETRYPDILINSSFISAGQGKLKEFGHYKLDELNCFTRDEQIIAYTHMKTVNAFLIGDCAESKQLIDEHALQLKGKDPERISIFKNQIQLISGDFNDANYQDKGLKKIVNIFHLLSICKYDEASLLYKEFIKNSRQVTLISIFSNFIPLHLELCQGNKGMAKLILQDKIKKGNISYFEDFFTGRLQLLENDFEGADQSFTRLIENVNRYGAMNRLIFELEFAKEMKLSDVLLLMNGWKSSPKSASAKTKMSPPIKTIEIEKGVKLLVGKSESIKLVVNLVKKYSSLKAPVLVTGETGTGKELVSRAIHDEGPFPEEPFLAINCGALSDTLLLSELFGYEAGAFTGAQKQRKGIFEAAGKGTVFLDEFGDISPKLQVSLLRVLESNEIRLIGSTVNRKIECKIVIATNVDLHDAVVEKKFREDLFFRLAKFEIKLPALRERREDLAELIQYFLDKNSRSSGSKKVSKELLNKLEEYHWPGNIRELKNETDRLFILNPDIDVYGLEHFDFTHLQEAITTKLVARSVSASPIHQAVELPSKENQLLKILENGFPVEARHNQIKDLFRKYKKLTRSQIMGIVNISTTTATKDLQVLLEMGFIVRRTPTKSTRTDYFEIVV